MLTVLAIKRCDNCGKEVVITHKDRLKRKHIFCSKSCQAEYTKKNNPNWVQCVVCGKRVYRKPRQLKENKQGVCCSTACMGILRQTQYEGKNNPNYGNKGNKNPIWKSDKRISSYGYILVRSLDHPFANGDGFVFEHRLVAEKYLLTEETSIEINGKKYLSPDYVVHHKDGNRQNNNVDNLEIMTLSEHTSYHQAKRKELAS